VGSQASTYGPPFYDSDVIESLSEHDLYMAALVCFLFFAGQESSANALAASKKWQSRNEFSCQRFAEEVLTSHCWKRDCNQEMLALLKALAVEKDVDFNTPGDRADLRNILIRFSSSGNAYNSVELRNNFQDSHELQQKLRALPPLECKEGSGQNENQEDAKSSAPKVNQKSKGIQKAKGPAKKPGKKAKGGSTRQ
jgi:hypothetical protein